MSATLITSTLLLVFITITLLVATSTLVAAYPSFQKAIPNGDRISRNGESWPGVGHEKSEGGGNELNGFGKDFLSHGSRWTPPLCKMDSDGDGFSNGMELGDPNCVWTAKDTTPPSRVIDLSHPGYADSKPSGVSNEDEL